MSYEPLHHKYRPQTFGDLVGQEAIAATLTSAIAQNRIAPAYLLTGPRGTGKTSSARILAKSLNCLASEVPTPTPCGVCDVCRSIARGEEIDAIEIDAASHTGVDNVRELIERAQLTPVRCRRKVYIIDECHMLSTAAFNALLKTLEEPPEHVVFVLATTNPERVLPTIISRCQRFDFRRIPLQAMVAHLQTIAQAEGIAIESEAIALVAQIAQGGLRDAESLLDQLSLAEDRVTVEQVWDLVGAVPERDLLALARAIAANDPAQVLDCCRHLLDRGREPLTVLQGLAGTYRDLLVAKTAPRRRDLVACTDATWQQLGELARSQDLPNLLHLQKYLQEAEAQIKRATQPRLWLEVTLLGLLPAAIAPATPTAPTQTAPVPHIPPNGTALVPPAAPIPPIVNAPPDTPSEPAPPEAAVERSVERAAEVSNEPSPQVPAEVSAETPTEAIAPTPSLSSPPLPTPYSTQVELDDLWQKILSTQKRATQALLGNFSLLEFNGKVARVGASSAAWIKLAQAKVAEIEEAFARHLHQQVEVRIELVKKTPSASEAIAPYDTQESETADPPPETDEELPEQPSLNRRYTEPHPIIQTQAPRAITGDRSREPVLSMSEELDLAAKRVASFFHGEVTSPPSGTVVPPQPPSSHNANDVPF